jgi:hypothetical protein
MALNVLPHVGDEILLSVPQAEQVLARVRRDGPGYYDLELLQTPITAQRQLARCALMIEFVNEDGVARLHGRLDAPSYRPQAAAPGLVRFAHRGSPQRLTRREDVRATVALELELRGEDGGQPIVTQAQALELSGGGLLAGGLPNARVGTALAFALRLAVDGEVVEGRCEVVRVVDGATVGLQFTELEHGARVRLMQLAFEMSREQRRRSI